jgi:hypothetical protein
MKILKSKTSHPKKQILKISDLVFIKKDPLPALMNGEQMINPIEIQQHQISPVTRYGAGGVIYKEKKYSTYKGSQRINAAIQLGYTHIEAIVND